MDIFLHSSLSKDVGIYIQLGIEVDDGPSWKEDEGSVNLENTCGGGI